MSIIAEVSSRLARLGGGALLVLSCLAGVAPVAAQCEETVLLGQRTFDLHGYSVALDGDAAVVGAPGVGDAAGVAIVYRRDGETWRRACVLHAPAPEAGQRFGEAVAISGGTIVVGTRFAGAAYVFEDGGGDAWPLSAELTASDDCDALFGLSVALHGDVLVVGGPWCEEGGVLAGAAYVYRRRGESGWAFEQRLTGEDPFQGERFAQSLALRGGVLVCGVASDTDAQGARTGSAVVFTHEGRDGWVRQARLWPTEAEDRDHYGTSVGMDGDVLVVGAGPSVVADAAVYRRDGDGAWNEEAFLSPPPLPFESWRSFGGAVAVRGDTVFIGAPLAEPGPVTRGAAVVYRRIDGAWTAGEPIAAWSTSDLDALGTAMAVDGDALLIGAPGHGAGSVAVFGGLDGPALDCAVDTSDPCDFADDVPPDLWRLWQVDDVEDSFFGLRVAISGDFAAATQSHPDFDVLNRLTAYRRTSAQRPWRRVAEPAMIEGFLGGGLAVNEQRIVTGGAGPTYLRVFRVSADEPWIEESVEPVPVDGGYVLAIAGDRILATTYTMRLFQWDPDGGIWALAHQFAEHPDDVGNGFDGISAIGSDGSIVAAGVPFVDAPDGTLNSGAAYIYRPDDDGGWELTTRIAALEPVDNARFGVALDVEGDCLAVTARNPNANGGVGVVYVYGFDGRDGWTLQQELHPTPVPEAQFFGSAVVIDGDRICVSSESAIGSEPAPEPGAVYVYEQRASGVWVQTRRIAPAGITPQDRFGTRLAADSGSLIAAAPNESYSQPNRGGVWAIELDLRTDCNGNAIVDACDIADGTADSDGDGRLDACEAACPADITADVLVDHADFDRVFSAWGLADPAADVNNDGIVEVMDLVAVIEQWGSCR